MSQALTLFVQYYLALGWKLKDESLQECPKCKRFSYFTFTKPDKEIHRCPHCDVVKGEVVRHLSV